VEQDAVLWSYMQYFSQRPYLADIEYLPHILSSYKTFMHKFDKIEQCKNLDVLEVALICQLHIEINQLSVKVREQFDQFLKGKSPEKDVFLREKAPVNDEIEMEGVIIDD
jgi:hypothetical protein